MCCLRPWYLHSNNQQLITSDAHTHHLSINHSSNIQKAGIWRRAPFAISENRDQATLSVPPLDSRRFLRYSFFAAVSTFVMTACRKVASRHTRSAPRKAQDSINSSLAAGARVKSHDQQLMRLCPSTVSASPRPQALTCAWTWASKKQIDHFLNRQHPPRPPMATASSPPKQLDA